MRKQTQIKVHIYLLFYFSVKTDFIFLLSVVGFLILFFIELHSDYNFVFHSLSFSCFHHLGYFSFT